MAYSKIKKDGKQSLPVRPLKVADTDFIRITNDYIRDCKEKNLIPLKKELALLLGIDTDTLNRYSKYSHRAGIIKRVEELSELGWVRYAEKTNKPIFPIFMLKAQHGYIEQQRLDLTSGGHLLGTINLPKRT